MHPGSHGNAGLLQVLGPCSGADGPAAQGLGDGESLRPAGKRRRPPGQFPGAAVLEILRGLYHYEKLRYVFDPRRNIALLPVKEIRKEHYTREYLRFYTLVRERYLYEFMRLGTEVTPFNTL